MEDRYGPLPVAAKNLLEIMYHCEPKGGSIMIKSLDVFTILNFLIIPFFTQPMDPPSAAKKTNTPLAPTVLMPLSTIEPLAVGNWCD